MARPTLHKEGEVAELLDQLDTTSRSTCDTMGWPLIRHFSANGQEASVTDWCYLSSGHFWTFKLLLGAWPKSYQPLQWIWSHAK